MNTWVLASSPKAMASTILSEERDSNPLLVPLMLLIESNSSPAKNASKKKKSSEKFTIVNFDMV